MPSTGRLARQKAAAETPVEGVSRRPQSMLGSCSREGSSQLAGGPLVWWCLCPAGKDTWEQREKPFPFLGLAMAPGDKA